MAEKILTTGKYLNVMLECGRDAKLLDEEEPLVYTNNANEYVARNFNDNANSSRYVEKIDRAYSIASRKLLELLCGELDLLNRLKYAIGIK